MEGLRKKRIEQRYTLKAVAEAVGVTILTIFNYENGKRFPNREMLMKLAAFFDCTVDELL